LIGIFEKKALYVKMFRYQYVVKEHVVFIIYTVCVVAANRRM